MLRVLRRRDFGVLWLGGLLSLLGDWMLITALPLVVYQLTGSTLALGATVVAQTLPRVVVGSVAGIFVDRWDRRRTMLVCDILLGIGLLPLLLVRSGADLWLVGLVLLFESSVVQFYKPAEAAFLPRLVAAEDLVAANALNGLSSNAARLGAPPLGALLVAIGGLQTVALVDAVSFLLAAASVWLVHVKLDERCEKRRQPLWLDWLTGVREVRRNRTARVVLIFLAVTGIGEGLVSTLFVPFATRVMHGDELTFGALLSAQAIGGVAGGVLLGRFADRLSPTTILGGTAIGMGLLDLAVFYSPLLTPQPLVTFGLMALVGLPTAGILASAYTLLQTSVEHDKLGRIFGAGLAVAALTQIVGAGIAGLLIDAVGIVPLLTVQGLGYTTAGCVVLAALSRRARSRGGPGCIDPDGLRCPPATG